MSKLVLKVKSYTDTKWTTFGKYDNLDELLKAIEEGEELGKYQWWITNDKKPKKKGRKKIFEQ